MIELAGLSVHTSAGGRILDAVDLSVPAGQVRALVGESGSGKTTAALALFGMLRPGLVVTGGTVRVAGQEPLSLRGAALRRFRRTKLAWLGQDPALALNPYLTIGELLREAAPRGTSDTVLLELAASLGLGDIDGLLQRRPRQLSGGQRRRAAFVRAIASDPELLVLDEPTNGLDEEAIAQVAGAIEDLRCRRELTVLLITHDLNFARRVAEEISFMQSGQVVESLASSNLTAATSQLACEALAAAMLDGRPGSYRGEDAAALRTDGLSVCTPSGEKVADSLDLNLQRGQSLALLGRSGLGKTTLVRTLIGTHLPESGELRLNDEPVPWPLAQRTPAQRRKIQMISQDPAGSLNPAVTIGRQLNRAVRRSRPGLGRDATAHEVERLLQEVNLTLETAAVLPRTLSGGQAQRVAIARALAHEPEVLLCDEATSSLDPTIQRSVLELLDSLRLSRGLSLLVITHSAAVARFSASRTLRLEGEGRVRWD